MRQNKAIAGLAFSFTAFVVLVIFLLIRKVISFEMAMLMLVALVGLHFGFGVLIAIYRFVSRLE